MIVHRFLPVMSITTLATLSAFLTSFLSPLSAEEEKSPLNVAVFDFADGDESLAGTGVKVGQLLNAFLSASEGVLLVERQELDRILEEQELQLSGTVDPQAAVGIGRLTGAEVLVSGRAFLVGKQYYLVARVTSAETGRIFGQTAKFTDAEDLGTASEELAGKIAAVLLEKRADLVSPAETPEARLARLAELLPEGFKFPTVSVSIPETHLTRAVPDPAAQTEILLTLQEVGFSLAKEGDGKASIRVTGEAFSERAGARGGLISCRARCEIEVFDKKGQLLFVDRETEVAVDVAENVAAKTALQKAGAALAERIVERLAKR